MQHKCQQSAPSRSTGRARTEEVTSLISIQLPGVVFCRANQSLAQHGKLSHHPAAADVTAAASLITTRKLFAGKVTWRHSQSCMLRPAVPVTSGHTKSRYGRFALPAYVYLCCQTNRCRSAIYQSQVSGTTTCLHLQATVQPIIWTLLATFKVDSRHGLPT